MIYELREKHPLNVLFDVAEISKSTYYYHLKNGGYLEKNKEAADLIEEIFDKSKQTYGYRRITAELKNLGLAINHKKVLKIMKLKNIKPNYKKVKKYNSYKGLVGEVSDNIIQRDFNASEPYTKFATDITEFKIPEGKVFLSPIIDMFNREIVSYSIGYSPSMMLIMDTLDGLFNLNVNLENAILHSDRGWHYQNHEYCNALKKNGIIQSMSRKGNCNDNGLIESFFGVLKNEMFYGKEDSFKSVENLAFAIEEYITFYNTVRIKSRLNFMSPVDYKKAKLQLC